MQEEGDKHPLICCGNEYVLGYETGKVVTIYDWRIWFAHKILLSGVYGVGFWMFFWERGYCEHDPILDNHYSLTKWWTENDYNEYVNTVNTNDVSYCNGTVSQDYNWGAGFVYEDNTCDWHYNPADFSVKTAKGLALSSIIGFRNSTSGEIDDWYFPPGIEHMLGYFEVKISKEPDYYGIPETVFEKNDGSTEKVMTRADSDSTQNVHYKVLDLLQEFDFSLESRNENVQPSINDNHTEPQPTFRLTGVRFNLDFHVSNFEHAENLFDSKLRAVIKVETSKDEGVFVCDGWKLGRTANSRVEREYPGVNFDHLPTESQSFPVDPIDYGYHCVVSIDVTVRGLTCNFDVLVAMVQITSFFVLLGLATIVTNYFLAKFHATFGKVKADSADQVMWMNNVVNELEKDYKRLSLRKTFFGEPPNESLLNEDKKKRKTSEDSELIEAEFYEDLDVGDNVAEAYIATRDFLVGGFHVRKNWVLYVVNKMGDDIQVMNRNLERNVWIPKKIFWMLECAPRDVVQKGLHEISSSGTKKTAGRIEMASRPPKE